MNTDLAYVSRSKFAADAEDIDYQANRSIRFAIRKDGSLLIDETYTPDSDARIRIRGVADILSQSLYGELKEGLQPSAKGVFAFYVNNTHVSSDQTIYAMRLQNPYDPDGEKTVMAVARETTCRPGRPFLLTMIGRQTVTLLDAAGRETATVTVGSNSGVSTIDLDPYKAFTVAAVNRSRWMLVGSEVKARIVGDNCPQAVAVRFLNRYDVPESVVAEEMQEKPSAKDDVSVMYGQQTRFSVQSSTEYTLHSGPLRHADEYDTWQDLLTSRKAQLLWQGRWIDIIVTKSNYTRRRRNFYGDQVVISFQTANPYMTL